jgi:hypothetical protein
LCTELRSGGSTGVLDPPVALAVVTIVLALEPEPEPEPEPFEPILFSSSSQLYSCALSSGSSLGVGAAATVDPLPLSLRDLSFVVSATVVEPLPLSLRVLSFVVSATVVEPLPLSLRDSSFSTRT